MMFRYTHIVFLLFFVSPASATNFYAGFNVGITDQGGDFTVTDTTLNPAVGIDELSDYKVPDDTGISGMFFMGYKLGADISIEVGYQINNINTEKEIVEGGSTLRVLDNGNSVIESAETRYTSVAFVGFWPIHRRWALNARLGFSVWDMTYKQTEINTLLDPSDTGYIVQSQVLSDSTSATLLGVGVSFGVTKNIELKLNAENHFVDFSFTNLELDYKAITYSLGAAYHF